jgi:hypothetical protein
MLGLSAPMVSAQVVTFSNANYVGRYACTNAVRSDSLTAVIKYNPNGSGAYSAGTLVAALTPFAPFGTASPSMSFCNYTLDIAASSYNIASDGTGFEQLVWTAATTNNGACPPSFEDQTAIGLRNMQDATGIAVIRAEFASANLLNGNEAGHGTCLK